MESRRAGNPHDPMNKERLFRASCLALIVTAMSFAIRGDIMAALGTEFALSNEQLGWVAGTAFWGFTLAMLFGGPLCDVLGMGFLLRAAFVGHLGGILLTIFSTGFWPLFGGTLCIGLANGLVEAACNPLVATLYPQEKTKRLNQFHVWFPGGIVIGGLLAFLFSLMHLDWRWKMAAMLVPLACYAGLFRGMRFPRTERVVSGVSTRGMFRECARPLFLFMVVCMLGTSASELGPNQWIPSILTENAGMPGILILVWINGLMAAGRSMAGPVVHKLSPAGTLLFSSVFSALGLLALSFARGPVPTLAAATLFSVGVCYFWPTMLGFTSERLPRTGALGLAIMGGAGMLSVSLVLPWMGHLYDWQILKYLGEGASIETLRNAAAGSQEAIRWAAATAAGGQGTLRIVALLPGMLLIAFALLYLRDRRQMGRQAGVTDGVARGRERVG